MVVVVVVVCVVGSVEALSGPADMAPIFRPVEMTLIPNHVDTFNGIANALRHTEHICTLLEYQSGTIKNTFMMRCALIQHLFTNVIPIPLSREHVRKRQCMWSQSIRYETQVDILRLIMLLSRHFAASSMSLKVAIQIQIQIQISNSNFKTLNSSWY